jgi:hypothetical protein
MSLNQKNKQEQHVLLKIQHIESTSGHAGNISGTSPPSTKQI